MIHDNVQGERCLFNMISFPFHVLSLVGHSRPTPTTTFKVYEAIKIHSSSDIQEASTEIHEIISSLSGFVYHLGRTVHSYSYTITYSYT
jgi:hypothetical protein